MAFEEDMTVFFRTDELAVDAVLGNGRAVQVIFDAEYRGLAGGVIEGSGPTATGMDTEDQLGDVHIDDTITIDDVLWRVIGREPDGTGEVVLRLRRAV